MQKVLLASLCGFSQMSAYQPYKNVFLKIVIKRTLGNTRSIQYFFNACIVESLFMNYLGAFLKYC